MKGLLLSSLPIGMDFYPMATGEFRRQHGAAFDQERYDELCFELSFAGCENLGDWRVLMQYAPDAKIPPPTPGIARLFVHPTHHFFAEVNQVIGPGAPPVSCNVVSHAEPDWSLETTSTPSYSADSILYAMRRPHAMWSRHPNLSPRQLCDLHVRQRERVFGDLGLTPSEGLNFEAYCRREREVCLQRRNRVQNSSSLQLMWDILFSKGKMSWWGEYAKKFGSGPPKLES